MNALQTERLSEGFTLPSEVLKRFGGLTSAQKQRLYDIHQSLDFVWIPEHLKSAITGTGSLLKYGVCKSPPGSPYLPKPYFICPLVQSSTALLTEDARFCCGPSTHQTCCTLSTFSADIRVVQSTPIFSPSALIGLCLVFLLLSILVAILAYASVARGMRKESSAISHSCRQGSIHVPPPKHLLSSKNSDTYSYVKSSSHDQSAAYSEIPKFPQNDGDRSSHFTADTSGKPLALRMLGVNYEADSITGKNAVQVAKKMNQRKSYRGSSFP